VLALIPWNHLFDIASLCQLLDRDLEPLPEHRFREVFPDCEPGCCPTLGRAYGVATAVDIQLYKHLELAFEPGHRHAVVRLPTGEFQRIMQTVELGHFSCSLDGAGSPRQDPAHDGHEALDMNHLFPRRAAQAVDRCNGLPALPETASRLLRLAADPNADVAALAGIIKRDAPTAARILGYANSSLYGFSGKIHDLKGAIARVLGFDVAMGIAIGMNIGKTLRVPTAGVLGLDAFRRDSTYCAELAKLLAKHLPAHLEVIAGKAYMAGLLHNIGFLFLGQVFPEQHRMLEKAIAVNPGVPVTVLEDLTLHTGHGALGERLLGTWGLPREVVATARHHHDAAYQGDHAPYVHLIGVAAYLLGEYGISECMRTAVPSQSLACLELTEASARETIEEMLEKRDAFEQLVTLVA
jgi:HD-like signal output (HDOD) protein